MNEIEVELGKRSYPVYVQSESLAEIGALAEKHGLGRKIALITDVNVAPFYQEEIEAGLRQHDFQVLGFILPAGEQTKNLKMADYLYEKLIEANFDRNSVIMSLGGGVVGDLAGFVAATFMRGVTFVQIPTTLLAQTDSSVGGKVGINHRLGKNLIGAFHQPRFVLVDPTVLKTLPQRELWAGMAEVVKYGMIYDRDFFEFLNENLTDIILLKNMETLEMVVEHCCSIKAYIVKNDEKEMGLRRILNFGHTVGHALEALTDYSYFRHGEAVVLGMRAAGWLSNTLGLLPTETFHEMDQFLQRMKLPESLPDFKPQDIIEKVYHDKKVVNGILHWVLLEDIGKAVVRNDVDDRDILAALDFLRKQVLVSNISKQKIKSFSK